MSHDNGDGEEDTLTSTSPPPMSGERIAAIEHWQAEHARQHRLILQRIDKLSDKIDQNHSASVSLADALLGLTGQVRKLGQELADMSAKIAVDLSRLHRQDSIHDEAIQDQQTKIVTVKDQLSGLMTLRNSVRLLAVGIVSSIPHLIKLIAEAFQ